MIIDWAQEKSVTEMGDTAKKGREKLLGGKGPGTRETAESEEREKYGQRKETDGQRGQ